MKIKTFISCMLAFMQMLGITLGVISIGEADVDYGGEPYSEAAIAEYLTLIKDGASDYVIVKGANAPPAEVKAARELQKYLYQISGVELLIRDDTGRVVETEILVGKTDREKSNLYKIDRDSLGEEGFTMFTCGKRLIIAGGGERGTLYGVYTFLEEQLGCRWFTDDLTVVPEADEVKINAELNDTQKPYFEFRYTGWKGSADFKFKNKYNYTYGGRADLGGGQRYAAFCHTLPLMVPDSLFETNSELFAYRKDLGARTAEHVCLSNPDSVSVAIENTREILKKEAATSTFFCIGQKDNLNYCQCERCEQLYEKHESTSATMVMFTNSVAAALKDEFPGMRFSFLAYQYTRKPPVDLVCESNVVPMVCTIEACYVHPLTECGNEDGADTDGFMYQYSDHEPQNAKDLKDWADISQEIHFYDYTVNFLNTIQFYPNFHTFADNFQYLLSIGCTGLYESGNAGAGSESGEFGELRAYLIMKLMWNPYCDAEYHIMDFMRAYYGAEAAEYIKEYIDIATHKIANTTHAFCFDWHYQIGYFNIREISRFDSLWDKAEASAENEAQLANIKRSRLQLRYYKANLLMEEFNPFYPLRGKENEKLYDDFVANGITRVTSFTPMPEKDEIDFYHSRPLDWR